MTWFDGWACTNINSEIKKENKEIYAKTNYRGVQSIVKMERDQYVHFEGNVIRNSKLTEKQLFIYACEGNGVHGGYCTRIGHVFYGQFNKVEHKKSEKDA